MDNQNVVASLAVDGKNYAINPIGGGIHVLINIDVKKYKPEEDPIIIKDKSSNEDALNKAEATIQSDIDILVAYTPAAGAVVSNMSTLINNIIFQSNLSFIESDIDVTYHLAYSTEINIVEGSKSSETILGEFSENQSILALRDEYRADLCFLITNSNNVTGIAMLPSNPSSYTSYAAFAIGNGIIKHFPTKRVITLVHTIISKKYLIKDTNMVI